MSKIKLGIARSPHSFGIFKDFETDWFFKRTLEYMIEKAAEIGECLYVARRIDETDGESWIKEWADMAEKVSKAAEESLSENHTVSAREAFVRASNYYRAAEYGTPPSHPRFHELWEKSRNSFHKACPLYNPPIQIIGIPFEGKTLPGYFWRPDNSDIKRPTLIVAGGNDSSGEEVVFAGGPATVRRGYNFFTFEFPGHRGAVHLYPDCVKRPDYEVPFKAAIDYLETRPGVDERIALTGLSYGGYVSARVAIYEPRIKALIPNSPIVDAKRISQAAWGSLLKGIPTFLLKRLLTWRLRKKPVMKAFFEYSLWTSGYGRSLDDIFDRGIMEKTAEAQKQYSIVNDLHKITIPALALVSEDEGEELVRQAREFYEGISSEIKKLHIFTLDKDGSSDHCQLDNRSRGNQVTFDWLDEVFSYTYEPSFFSDP
ncbi:MAG: alpha/beta hydrolase [Theionarchaea archaeon]|nr:alpha/beta hydrolase [Theionarchaea archaeon]